MDKITWQALEFTHHKKTASWFGALWIITAGLIVVAIITKNLFVGILILVSASVISLFGAKKPQKITFSLDETELTIENKPYPLANFRSFWIQKTENETTLLLNPKKILQPYIKISIANEDASNIRLILRSQIEEAEQEESLIDVLADWLKF